MRQPQRVVKRAGFYLIAAYAEGIGILGGANVDKKAYKIDAETTP